jgi:4-diphosphocytidyl-2-C-methyl-D-erythritol kinase
VEKNSPCKVNLLLNVLGQRPDGFHELETVLHPVNLCDQLTFARGGTGIQLSCSDANLPTDERNLVHRAATAFLQVAKISEGVKIHLEKKIPLAAGLGGGSSNAATTLLALNELFGSPLPPEKLSELAAALGSDVSFFLQAKPALATGRGEKIQPLDFFPALRGKAFLLIHPGFGIATPWAYQNLARFPAALNGCPGRAAELIAALQSNFPLTRPSDTLSPNGGKGRGEGAFCRKPNEMRCDNFYNSLEAPALEKFPILGLFQEFLRENGALAALMSGSGSTTFAIVGNVAAAEALAEKFKAQFGKNCWTAVVEIC